MHATVKRAVTAVGLIAATCGSLAAADDTAAGKQLFTQTAAPACAVCHTLQHAGATGEIGPSLDELKPDASRVEKAVRNGIGQMPAFKALSDEQIRVLGQYVAAVTAAK